MFTYVFNSICVRNTQKLSKVNKDGGVFRRLKKKHQPF